MTKEELLAEIEKHGGKIEPIEQVCQFETFGKSIFDFCIQPKDSPYWVNLGSAGGLAVTCDGMPRLKRYKTKTIGGKEVTEPDYEGIEPCPFKAKGKILGWRIMLPAGD